MTSSSAIRTQAGPQRARSSDRPPPRDPLARVMTLGMRKHTKVMIAALAAALLVHGTAAARVAVIDLDLIAWTHAIRFAINDKLAATYDIDVEKPKPPEPPPEEPKPEEPKPVEKAPPPSKAEAPKDTPPPPPAAAQAGAVLTEKPDPNAPVDFTNSIVVGNGDAFAGGVTQAQGTSKTAVYNRNAQAGGVPGGTGTAPAPAAPRVDRSRTLSATKGDWNCTFPSEADTEQIDDMTVPIEATVGPDGRVTNARALSDPGYGFGRAAVQCALRQSSDTFSVALDADGHPIVATRKFNVHFTR